MTKAEVEALRKEIERIDSKILELVSQRRQASIEMGLVKKKNGLPVRDRSREKKVRENYAMKAHEKGIDRKLAIRLADLLMADSVDIQRGKFKRDLQGKTALVVGGSGRTGAWFCRHLSNRGAIVRVWDPRGRLEGYENIRSLKPAASESDIVVVASPLGVAPSELRLVLREDPKGLVFDVCSVKTHIAKQLCKAAQSGTKVASAHPMFGPSASTAVGRTFIVCDCGSPEGNSQAVQLISRGGAKVVRLTLEEHDELMAYILGLSHLSALAFATTVASSGKSLASLTRAQGTSFERMLASSRELSRESVRVYHDIQALNPNTKAMFSNFINSVKLLKKASMRKDPSEFRSIMESNRKYLEVR